MTEPIDAVELTQELIRFRTVNPPGEEQACAAFLGGMLEGLGFAVAYSEFSPRRTTLVARLGAGAAPLCFTGHLDTVPLGRAAWSVDPFAGEIRDGRLYGRGASDMKAGIAAFIAAAAAEREALRAGPGQLLVITAG